MKTTNKTIFLFVIGILFLACKSDEPKLEENVVQSVKSSLDCIDSQGWSWDNDTATAIYGWSGYIDESAYFEIKVKSEGVFIFDYTLESSYNYSLGKSAWLSVAVDEQQCFYKEGGKEEKTVKIGRVSKGQLIRFNANLYESSACVAVYNIRIVAEDGENPSNWDF